MTFEAFSEYVSEEVTPMQLMGSRTWDAMSSITTVTDDTNDTDTPHSEDFVCCEEVELINPPSPGKPDLSELFDFTETNVSELSSTLWSSSEEVVRRPYVFARGRTGQFVLTRRSPSPLSSPRFLDETLSENTTAFGVNQELSWRSVEPPPRLNRFSSEYVDTSFAVRRKSFSGFHEVASLDDTTHT